MRDELVKGIFVTEIKNRFLCQVKLNNDIIECYIPSSCRLSNFLSLEGKEVLLKKTMGKNTRTDYAVYAVKYKRGYILLNLSQANQVIENNINRRLFCGLGPRKHVVREQTIEGYKSDLYIAETDTIIEIKSLLTTEKVGFFPTVYSERANSQLVKIKQLLTNGHRVCYMVVSLNPYIKEIALSDYDAAFKNLFLECIGLGMTCMGLALNFVDGKPIVGKCIQIKN